MKTVRFAMYIMYKWKLNEKDELPYAIMIRNMTLLVWANLIAILCFFGKGFLAFGGSTTAVLAKNSLLFILLAFLISQLGSRKQLCKIRREKREIGRYENYLMVYIGISILAVVIGIIIHP